MAEKPATAARANIVICTATPENPSSLGLGGSSGTVLRGQLPVVTERATANTKSKRAYHTKDRHGCKTCKIRKVRCDKLKPACNRCITSRRKCDGYDTTPAFALPRSRVPASASASASVLPPTISASAVETRPFLSMPGKSSKEFRGFHYFMEAIAPILAGSFVVDFWMSEVPRACHMDDAVWHAIISLASAYECLVSGRANGAAGRAHTLLHYNLSVQELLRSYSAEGYWRTLTLSILFTSICCLELKYEEAQMHTKSACKLLREVDSAASSRFSLDGSRLQPTPVSMASLRFMLDALEMKDRQLDAAKS